MLCCSGDCSSSSLKSWWWLLMSPQCCQLQGCWSDGLYLLVSKNLWPQQCLGVKQPKALVFRATQRCIFLPGAPNIFLSFCCCSMPDRHLQTPLEDLHGGGQPGVNLSCLSDLALPAWSQLSAFAIHAAENYQAQEQVTSPKRQFKGSHFSPSLTTVS